MLSADLGLAVSSADEGYGSLTAGLEVLPFPRAVVSPFARAEVGAAGRAGVLQATWPASAAASSVRLNEQISLRGGASWGTHGDVKGPVVYSGGLQLRW